MEFDVLEYATLSEWNFERSDFKEVIRRSVRTYGGMSQESYIKQEAMDRLGAFLRDVLGRSRERYRDDALPEIGDSLSEYCVKVIP